MANLQLIHDENLYDCLVLLPAVVACQYNIQCGCFVGSIFGGSVVYFAVIFYKNNRLCGYRRLSTLF
jgi:hypothetical protein